MVSIFKKFNRGEEGRQEGIESNGTYDLPAELPFLLEDGFMQDAGNAVSKPVLQYLIDAKELFLPSPTLFKVFISHLNFLSFFPC